MFTVSNSSLHLTQSHQFLSLLRSPFLSRERKLKASSMAFVSFLGRVLFVSVFVLSAWQEFNEFGNDGGSAAKTLVPKFSVFSKHVTAHTGFQIKILVAGAIALKGIGSLLFIFGSTIGAFLLILHQLIATPILYDFYNYDVEKKEFSQLFIKFTQVKHVLQHSELEMPLT
ncbi:HR-like lesion-inducer [Cynara cardunculus var. scolymus]|uniref:HR-like lesion-inducer n=1 Tax=Cynara cardunculus var. scolymus TaxID=59895 RepID=A0A103XC68_CYNCS|nr:HR-like lesion-inducer [Cynara cardunculus var. scolymus]